MTHASGLQTAQLDLVRLLETWRQQFSPREFAILVNLLFTEPGRSFQPDRLDTTAASAWGPRTGSPALPRRCHGRRDPARQAADRADGRTRNTRFGPLFGVVMQAGLVLRLPPRGLR